MIRSLLLIAALTLAAPAFAQEAGAPLSIEREREVRVSVYAAAQAPDFNNSRMWLEVYRTLRGAGVALTSEEAFSMGEQARMRGLAVESFEAFSLLQPDDPKYLQNERLIAHMRADALTDRQSGVEKSVEAARQRGSGDFFMIVAQALAGQGDHKRAVEHYELGLSRINRKQQIASRGPPGEAERAAWAAGQAKAHGRSIAFYELAAKQDPDVVFGYEPDQFPGVDLARCQLNYGISLFRLNRVADARAEWASIEGNAAAMILAKAWIDIADRSAN